MQGLVDFLNYHPALPQGPVSFVLSKWFGRITAYKFFSRHYHCTSYNLLQCGFAWGLTVLFSTCHSAYAAVHTVDTPCHCLHASAIGILSRSSLVFHGFRSWVHIDSDICITFPGSSSPDVLEKCKNIFPLKSS